MHRETTNELSEFEEGNILETKQDTVWSYQINAQLVQKDIRDTTRKEIRGNKAR